MLNHESIWKSCSDLIEMLLLQLLIIEESIEEVERFRFPCRFRLLIFLDHWSSRSTRLPLILSSSCLCLLNGLFSGCNFFSCRLRRIYSYHFLGVSLNLN